MIRLRFPRWSRPLTRRAKSTLLSLVVALLIGCSSASIPTAIPTETVGFVPQSNISTSIDYVYYPITGSTTDELRAQMDQLGRTDESGNHWDAYTEWDVTWSYPYSTANDDCTTGPIEMQVQVTFFLPQWDVPADASQDLVEKWNAYAAALQRHEDGHKEIAVEAGHKILQTLNSLPAYPLCSEVEQAADTAAESVLARYRQQENIYDQDTDHGATQGARFP